MPPYVSQLRSFLGGVSYYRKFFPKRAASTKFLNRLLSKGVKFVFTTEYLEIAQKLLNRLVSPKVLAFPYFKATISGNRPLC